MAGISGVISAYRQPDQINRGSERTYESTSSKVASSNSSKESQTSKVETKGFTPIDTKSSLVPKATEYGNTIGDVKLSDKAKDYYNQLKGKFHNMEFIAVSKDMKAQVQANAAAYGNANKMVVLIDEEKLERMATDESFRKKFEGIIAMSQTKMAEAKNSLTSSGASVKNFGMSVDSNGKENFFATVEKSQDLQKKRIEKKAAEKKAAKQQEKKKAEKKAQEERIQKTKDKKAEKTDSDKEDAEAIDNEEYITFEANSVDELLFKVQNYSYNSAAGRVMTESERMVGSKFDIKG
ncbi:MAG: hypothetical protein J6I68_04470 [Butyrivibrio sp.]|uniref:DUF6033 family protein n=1 Tax=Butyrivibrio sp. TaxID=28121 RepID=UPI001B4D6724|nr:DUF6033 family protein [Butyrivibrio sp.]MBP3782483.1 hypothetical protein [Butyrivibrio sp.]